MTKRGGWRYYADFVLFPLAAVSIALVYCRSLEWVGLAILGFLLWTFAEYWAHRSVLHRWFWHGIHERHHRHPAEYVVFPPLQLALYGAAYVAAFLMLPLSVFDGLLFGSSWFITLHHLLHHIDLQPHTLLHRYSIWHNRHHRFDDCNYGITVPVWDWLFRTSR